MSVSSPHPDYLSALPSWLRARDVLAGEDAIKADGEKYLPRIDSQSDEEYEAYLRRAAFFNATARTAEGYVGLLFRRPPFLKLPPSNEPARSSRRQEAPISDSGPAPASSIQNPVSEPASSIQNPVSAAFLSDCDLLGSSFSAYAKHIVTEVIAVGRAGTLIDWEDQAEQRPYVTFYSAEQILNWRVERVGGKNVPTLIVLKETGKLPGTPLSDPFLDDSVDQIRVLKLIADSPGGPRSVVIELWQLLQPQPGAKPDWQIVATKKPLRLGKPLSRIPFVFHGPRHSRPEVDAPPLNNIITVNLDHYRLDADYKHGLHYTALPTAWVSGFDKSATLKLGSSTAWVADSAGATAGFLEFTGQGLTSFERAMDRDERLMAVLGSRLLEDQKKVGETAQAIELRQSGENSILGSIAESVSESLTQVLRWAHWWTSSEALPEATTEESILVRLNTDFSTRGMASDELQAIVKAWQASAISRDTMLELFRKGEILPDGRTNQEETKLLGPRGTASSQAGAPATSPHSGAAAMAGSRA
jgi:hypothetical protein